MENSSQVVLVICWLRLTFAVVLARLSSARRPGGFKAKVPDKYGKIVVGVSRLGLLVCASIDDYYIDIGVLHSLIFFIYCVCAPTTTPLCNTYCLSGRSWQMYVDIHTDV